MSILVTPRLVEEGGRKLGRLGLMVREGTPTQLALAFCYRSWRVASTLIGVTSLAHLDENLDAWSVPLSPELLAAVDGIRLDTRDPAQ